MKRTLLFAFLLALTTLSTSTAQAQVEVGTSGNVGVRSGPSSSTGLYVTCWEDCFRQGSYTYGWGAYIRSQGKSRNRAVYGRASTGSGNPNAVVRNYGFYGIAEGAGNQNYGLYVRADGASDTGYGVYAASYGAQSNYAGYFSGDVHVTGTLTEASDAMFKRGVEALGGEGETAAAPRALAGKTALRGSEGGGETPPMSAVRAKLLELRPVKYEYRRGEYEDMGFPEGEHYGFLAQEVEAALPGLVTESVHPGAPEEIGEDGEVIQEEGEPLRYKSVNYLGLVPLLVQTAKEQQAEIEALRAEVEALQNLVEEDD